VELPGGEAWPVDEALALGKWCFRGDAPVQMFVSQAHCTIDCRSKEGCASVTVAGRLPVLLSRQSGESLLLRAGDSAHLQHNDALSLQRDLPERSSVRFLAHDASPPDNASFTRRKPIVLLLIGCQASGKSSLARTLCNQSSSWCSVSNDHEHGPSESKKKACIAKSKRALCHSYTPQHVCVDNTNTTASRRSDFVHLAHLLGASLHAVVLHMTRNDCERRIRQRRNHPSGVEGNEGVGVLRRDAKLEPPSPEDEGFESVQYCHSPCECNDIASLYASCGPPLEACNAPSADDGGHYQATKSVEPNSKERRISLDCSSSTQHSHETPPEPSTSDSSSRASSNRYKAHRNADAAPHPRLKDEILRSADNPKEHDTYLYHEEHLFVLQDKFPKGYMHDLVVARDKGIESIHSLDTSHISLLERMIAIGEWNLRERRGRESIPAAMFGFHSAPSLQPLHMHVISTDFMGSYMKSKRAWNSFTTPFFVEARDALEQLLESGIVSSPGYPVKLLKQHPCCHRVDCKITFRTAPEAIQHATRKCNKQLPGKE